MPSFDITILTESRYVDPGDGSPYIQNVLKEDQLVRTALEKIGDNCIASHPKSANLPT